MNPNIDPVRVDEVLQQVRSALEKKGDVQVREALVASLQFLSALTEGATVRSSKYAGSMLYTFEDENYRPHGRQIDLQIEYDWSDYDRSDEPFASWGPTIMDVNVLAVRFFDEDGNEVPSEVHYKQLALDLLDKHEEQFIEACTGHGYQHGVGTTPATYSRSGIARLAPSVPTRASQQNRRHLG
jgi:hypothetical protein